MRPGGTSVRDFADDTVPAQWRAEKQEAATAGPGDLTHSALSDHDGAERRHSFSGLHSLSTLPRPNVMDQDVSYQRGVNGVQTRANNT